MFSDESTFCISFGNQGPRVWRKRGEAQNPHRLRSSVKFPQSVMVWGAMSSAGVGTLCFLRSKVNTAIYQEVLEHFMLPAAIVLFYFIVCYLLNMVLFYSQYDVCSKNVIYKLINMLKVFQSIGQYWSVSVNLNNPMNFGWRPRI